jgi:hypothetical protein
MISSTAAQFCASSALVAVLVFERSGTAVAGEECPKLGLEERCRRLFLEQQIDPPAHGIVLVVDEVSTPAHPSERTRR